MSRLPKNILYNLVGQGLLLILGFVAVKYVFTRLGEDAFGVLFFSATLSAVLYVILELGICSTTVREVSGHFEEDPDYIREFVSTASLFCWGGYLLLALGVYWAAPVIVDRWINLDTMDARTATGMLRILGFGRLLALPRAFYASVVRGRQRMEFNNLIEVATVGLQQFGTIVILATGGGLFGVVYWISLCSAGGVAGYLVAVARLVSPKALLPCFSIAVVRRNRGYSANMMSISMLAMVHVQTDKLVVSKLLPIGTFGIYGFAYGVVSRAQLLTGAVSGAAFPALCSLAEKGETGAFARRYRQLQDLVCYLAVPVFAAIVFFGEPLMAYLLDPQAARLLRWPMLFLCLGFFMNGSLTVPYLSSLARGRPQITVRLNLYALIVVLPATVVLVMTLGILGAALSWVAYHLFAYAYAIPRICAQCLDQGAADWFGHLARVAAVAGLGYLPAWLVLKTAGAHSFASSGLAWGAGSLLFLALAYGAMGKELRGTLQRWKKAFGSHAHGL